MHRSIVIGIEKFHRLALTGTDRKEADRTPSSWSLGDKTFNDIFLSGVKTLNTQKKATDFPAGVRAPTGNRLREFSHELASMRFLMHFPVPCCVCVVHRLIGMAKSTHSLLEKLASLTKRKLRNVRVPSWKHGFFHHNAIRSRGTFIYIFLNYYPISGL